MKTDVKTVPLEKAQVGDYVEIWWWPNVVRVLRAYPYRGAYPQFFSRVLELEAPRCGASLPISVGPGCAHGL